MIILKSQEELHKYKESEGRIAFVPTMGNLHDGHISLITTAKKYSPNVLCSIFINPTQFSANEDFSTYPKTIDEDLKKLNASGVSAVYVPSIEDIYPTPSTLKLDIPHLTQCLCGISRPHFFGGVMTVVLKLILQISPQFLILGEKDYQQFLVVKEMVQSLSLPVEVISSPIIRNEKGLALSSRNGYFQDLTTPERINKILFDCVTKAKNSTVKSVIEQTKSQLDFLELDYLEVRSSKDLSPYKIGDNLSQFRLFFAGKIHGVRLIDNISFTL